MTLWPTLAARLAAVPVLAGAFAVLAGLRHRTPAPGAAAPTATGHPIPGEAAHPSPDRAASLR